MNEFFELEFATREVARMRAENVRLRKLVARAYQSGFILGAWYDCERPLGDELIERAWQNSDEFMALDIPKETS